MTLVFLQNKLIERFKLNSKSKYEYISPGWKKLWFKFIEIEKDIQNQKILLRL